MIVFRMNGVPIRSASGFFEHFSPEDFLRSRELAAGFACQQLWQMFSPRTFYCCKLLSQTVFNWENLRRILPGTPDTFFSKTAACLWMRNSRDENRMKAYTPDKRCSDLLTGLWEIAKEAGLSEEATAQLFLLLGAGYLLADKTLSECPLEPRRARAAFLREAAPEQSREEWIRIPSKGDICLPARPEPYRLMLRQKLAAELLSGGRPICPRRLIAQPHWQGSTSLNVVLEVYRDGEALEPERVKIQPGDYRYLNCIENVPFLLHPVCVRSGKTVLRRDGHTLCFRRGETEYRLAEKRQNIVCLAPEDRAPGYVLVTSTDVDYSRYSLRDQFSPFVCAGIVEAVIRDGICYTLSRDGDVIANSSRKRLIQSCVLTLGEVVL